MPESSLPPCSILLLAGGQGTRMGGQDKGLVAWKGAPLIERLYQVARPLTDDLIISCNRNQDRYADFADRLVVDSEPEFPGPLAGIRAGLSVARHPLMLVLPCDAPLVDQSLITDMRRLQLELPELPLMVRQGSQWQPLFCLIPKAWQARLELAWADGERSARRVLLELGAVALDIGSKDPRTANFNTPDLLAE